MTAISETPNKLTNLQATLLQVFDKNVSDSDLLEIKSLLSAYFFEKAQQEADEIMSTRNQTVEQLNEEVEALNIGNRTEYLRSIRNK
jgi:hypothetical protein